MKNPPVVFIANMEYYNLGIGYMAAVLGAAGYKTELIDFRDTKKEILRKIKDINPLIVGFSVIYQYNIDRFIKLIRYLRKAGIKCHFTAGGHYASLKFEELFDLIPSIDSIIRFEGEYTMRDLVMSICTGQEWRNIKSIVYLDKGNIVSNPLRRLEEDLDMFPYPLRTILPEYAFDKKFATMIAGRGCIYNCSYCNLKEFFLHFPGAVKRIRKPELVVQEMEYLFREKNCSVFLFQDDDFPVKNNNGEWILRFCEALKTSGLHDKIMWKINCRPDEIDEEYFSVMKENGLFLVFIGIEDGTDSGLEKLNKHMTVEKCLSGINTLKKLEIGFDFGFMLFQPDTTFRSLRNNIQFLRTICGDGSASVTFLKMMPYYMTRVEKELLAENRIKGEPGFRDYDFPDDSMNHYYEFLTQCFSDWTRQADGVANISKWARNHISVCNKYFGSLPLSQEISDDFKNVISGSNVFFLDTMRELIPCFESGNYAGNGYKKLNHYRKEIKAKHDLYKAQIVDTIKKLSLLVELLQNIKPHYIDTEFIKSAY